MKPGHILYAVLFLITVTAAKERVRPYAAEKLEGDAGDRRTLQQLRSSARATAIATAVATGDNEGAAKAIAVAAAEGDTEAIAEATAIASVRCIHASSSPT